jgi:hypothetical protein
MMMMLLLCEVDLLRIDDMTGSSGCQWPVFGMHLSMILLPQEAATQSCDV